MTLTDFTTAIEVDATPNKAFDSINQPQCWWPGDFEGETGKLGGEFNYRYKTFHYSKQKVTELVTGKKIVWQVTESSLNFVDDKTEWTGTTIIFEISRRRNKTLVTFTHKGLVPDFQCYNDCSNAWTGIIQNNLRGFIATGKPQTEFN